MPSLSVGKIGAAVGVAAAAGVTATAVVVGRRLVKNMRELEERAVEADAFGSLHGVPVDVRTDDDVRLSVEVYEHPDPDAPTLVFTHGFALNQEMWHYQRRDLTDLGRLVFWDARGHGDSEAGPPENANLEQVAADLSAVIEAVAPTGPLILIGHSMGGMATLLLGGRAPDLFVERVRAVALLSTAASDVRFNGLPKPLAALTRRFGPRVANTLARHPAVVERGLSVGDELVMLFTQAYGFGEDASSSMVAFTKQMHATTPLDVVAAMLPGFDEFDATIALAVIRGTETVVVVGDSDLLTPPERSEALAETIVGARLVVLPRTGHMTPLERPDEVNEEIRALVSRGLAPQAE
jgi:pimeloyl-ACP methyl ester carboxylesterase